MKKNLLYILFFCILFCNSAYALSGPQSLDWHLRKNTKVFFGISFDWQWFKMQAIAESGLNPKAVSPVGARGIMQIMPATWGDIKKRLPFIGHIENPKWNIAAGIFYNKQMWNIWKAKRPVKDRIAFMFASYNAGAGNILNAQKAAHGTNFWCELIKFADQVHRWKSEETIKYVAKIFRLMGVALCNERY